MIHYQFNKVKRMVRGVLPLCLLVLLPFATSCFQHEYDCIEEETVPLTFYLQTAGSQQTRAYIGEVPGTNDENAIRSIKVWLFDGSNCVSYSNTIDRTNNEVTMSIPKSYVGKNVDVYIIANPASVGLGAEEGEGALNAETPLNTLTAAIFKENFTAATPITAVPGNGLPMSRIVKDCPITLAADGIKATLPEIVITRAVSKIRFAFARTKEHTGQVLGITLNANQIAGQEYIFPIEPSEANAADYTSPYLGDLHANIVSGSYENTVMTLGSTDGSADLIVPFGDQTITEVYDDNDPTKDPTIYTWTNWSNSNAASSLSNQQKAETYNALMDNYTCKTLYLRESDKQLEGKIYYRLSSTGTVKSATFRMIANSDNLQDFARNHIWIVYGYFLGNKFNLIVQTIPWEDANVSIDYTETVTWKEEGSPSWTPALDGSNSSEEQIGASTYTVVHTDAGDTPKLTFNIDSPQGWEWIAVLEPLTDGAGDFISFANGSSAATGSVGQPATLNFKIATTATSEVHRARLKLYVRTTSHDQSLEVQAVKYIISRSN